MAVFTAWTVAIVWMSGGYDYFLVEKGLKTIWAQHWIPGVCRISRSVPFALPIKQREIRIIISAGVYLNMLALFSPRTEGLHSFQIAALGDAHW